MTNQAKRGFFPFVTGDDVEVRQAAVIVIVLGTQE